MSSEERMATMSFAGKIGASLLIIAAVIGNRANGGDWPQWLGPQRNGTSAEIVEPWKEAPRVVWRQSIGSGFSVPVVSNDALIVHAAVAGEDAESVVALDTKTGTVLWSDQYPRAKYRSELGSGPRATPIINQGRLFTIGITGVMSCYEVSSGKRLWQSNPYEDSKVPVPGFGVCSSPCVAGDLLVLSIGGAGNGVVAYKCEDGTRAWAALDEPAAAASPIVRKLTRSDKEPAKQADAPESSESLATTDSLEIIVQTTLRIVGLNPANGNLNWEHPLVFQPSGVSPTPLLSGERLICSTQDTGTLCLQLPSGNVAQPSTPQAPELKWWHEKASSYFSTGSVLSSDQVCVVTNTLLPIPQADVRCYETATGKEVWSKSRLGYFHVGLITTGDGKLLLLDDAGNLSLAQPADDYKALCTAKVCGGSFSNPVLANGLVFLRDRSGVLCVDTKAAPTKKDDK